MNEINYEGRALIYTGALRVYGETNQLTVALEELSEAQKEICKALRGQVNLEHLAEEVADATIMLEQVRLMFGINEMVCRYMDAKVRRLTDRMLKGLKWTEPSTKREEEEVP